MKALLRFLRALIRLPPTRLVLRPSELAASSAFAPGRRVVLGASRFVVLRF